jgi:alpha-tubulin suppressor-like RCC1 family protein
MKLCAISEIFFAVLAFFMVWLGVASNAYAGAVAVVADADGTAFFLDDEGSVWAFTKPDQIQGLVKLPNLSHIRQIVPFAALEDNGHVKTWDYSQNTICRSDEGGPLGRDVAYSTPKEVEGLSGVISISGIDRHFIALLKDGDVVQFGRKLIGSIENLEPSACTPVFKLDMLETPERLPNIKNVISISAGTASNSVLTSDGNVYSWGHLAFTDKWKMNLHRNILSSNPEDIFVGTNKITIFTGSNHLFALDRTGIVRVWGVCLDGSNNQGSVLSGAVQSVTAVKKIVINPASDSFPSAYILKDGQLVLSFPPDETGVNGWCNRGALPSSQSTGQVVSGLPIKVKDVALLDGSELANDWIFVIGIDGSVWKTLRNPLGGNSGFSNVSFP